MYFLRYICLDPPEGQSKQTASENQKSLTLACDTYQDAENWVTTIEMQIQELSEQQSLKDRDGDRNRYRSSKHIPRPEVRLAMVEKWVTTAKWKLFATHEGRCFDFLFVRRTCNDDLASSKL